MKMQPAYLAVAGCGVCMMLPGTNAPARNWSLLIILDHKIICSKSNPCYPFATLKCSLHVCIFHINGYLALFEIIERRLAIITWSIIEDRYSLAKRQVYGCQRTAPEENCIIEYTGFRSE